MYSYSCCWSEVEQIDACDMVAAAAGGAGAGAGASDVDWIHPALAGRVYERSLVVT